VCLLAGTCPAGTKKEFVMSRPAICRVAAVAAAVLAALFTALATPAVATPAASAHASQMIMLAAAERAEAVPLDTIVISYAGPAINRKGCGASVGSTPVIAWTPDRDACEDADIVSIPYMCGHGMVTLTCGMPSAALDRRYNGRPLVVVLFYNEGYNCLAAGAGARAVFGTCPSTSGSGGSIGTIYAWSASGYLVSRHSSGGSVPAWLCDIDGNGQALDTASFYDGGSYCQWDNAGIPGQVAPKRTLTRLDVELGA
jgi:hypothetical protein